jgi:hypothetical protein
MSIPASTRPSDSPTMWRWIGGLGIVYAICYAIGFFVLTNKEPSLKASPSRVVSYFSTHNTSGTVGVFAVVFACIAFAFFAGAVRNVIDASDGAGRRLSAIATTGTAVYVSGLLLMVAIRVTLLDAAHNHQPAIASVLSYLDHDNFFPMVAGLAIFLLATGISIVRTATLPAWLGWSAVAVGILAATGPLGAIASVVAPLWALCAAVVLVTRTHPTSDPGPRTFTMPEQTLSRSR